MESPKRITRSTVNSPQKPLDEVQGNQTRTPIKRRQSLRSQSTPNKSQHNTPSKTPTKRGLSVEATHGNTPSKRGIKRKVKEDQHVPTKSSKIQRSDSSDESTNLSSKSFYGSSKRKYMTPLERKELKQNGENEVNDKGFINVLAAAKAAERKKFQQKYKGRSSNVTSQRNCKVVPLKEITPATIQNLKNKNTKSPGKKSPSKKTTDGGKKFFRNRSPSKMARQSGTAVLMNKGGFDLKFKPGTLPKKVPKEEKALMANVSKASPRYRKLLGVDEIVSPRVSPRKKSVLNKNEMNELPQGSCNNTSNKFSQDLFDDWDDSSEFDNTDSGQYTASIKENQCSPVRPSNNLSSSRNTSTDSVLLLSEVGSEGSSPAHQSPHIGNY